MDSENGARPKMQEAGVEPRPGAKQTDDLTTEPDGCRIQLSSGSGSSLKNRTWEWAFRKQARIFANSGKGTR